MSDYTSEIEGAQSDIKAAGFAVTLRKNADTFNTYDGSVSSVQTDVTAYVVIVGASQFKGDTNYGKVTKAFLMSTENVTDSPVQGDQIIDGSSEYSVEIVRALEPNGVAILYKVAVNG